MKLPKDRHKPPSPHTLVSVALDTSVCETECRRMPSRILQVKPGNHRIPAGSSPAIAHKQGYAEGGVKQVNTGNQLNNEREKRFYFFALSKKLSIFVTK